MLFSSDSSLISSSSFAAMLLITCLHNLCLLHLHLHLIVLNDRLSSFVLYLEMRLYSVGI